MKTCYNFITSVLNSNMLSIFLGIIFGVAINVATGQKSLNEFYIYCLLTFGATSIFIFVLTYLRQSMDAELLNRTDVKASPNEKWGHVSRYDEINIRIIYVSSFVLTIVTICFGIFFLIKGNKFELGTETDTNRKFSEEIKSFRSEQQLIIRKIDSMKIQTPPVQPIREDTVVKKENGTRNSTQLQNTAKNNGS